MPYGHIRRAPKGKKAPVVRVPRTDTTHATGTYDGSKMLAQSVGTEKLGLQAVTSDILAADAVVAEKLADGSVVEAKLADAAVTTAKIADGSVDLTSKVAGELPDANIAAVSGSKVSSLPSPSLADDLRRNVKVSVQTTSEPTVSTSAVPFGGEAINDGAFTVDTLGEMTRTSSYNTYVPAGSAGVSYVIHVRAQIHARAVGLTLGCRARVRLKDTTASANKLVSNWFPAQIADDGAVEVIARLDSQVSLVAGHSHQVFVDVVDRDGAAFGGVTVKAEDPSSNLPGSFFEATGVPNA